MLHVLVGGALSLHKGGEGDVIASMTEVTWNVEAPAHQPGSHPVSCLLPSSWVRGAARGLLLALPVAAKSAIDWPFGDPVATIRELGYVDRAHIVACAPTFANEPWIADRRNASASPDGPLPLFNWNGGRPVQWFSYPGRPVLQQESYVLNVLLPLLRRNINALGFGFAPSAPVSLVSFSKGGFAAFSLLARHPDIFWQAAIWDAPLMLGGPFCDFLADPKRGNTDMWALRATYEDCDHFRSHAPLEILNASLFTSSPLRIQHSRARHQKPRVILLGSSHFGPWPEPRAMWPARSQTNMSVPSKAAVKRWELLKKQGLIPGAPFNHTVDFHRALVERHVPHVYNNSLPGPHCWRSDWVKAALDHMEWVPRRDLDSEGGKPAPLEQPPPPPLPPPPREPPAGHTSSARAHPPHPQHHQTRDEGSHITGSHAAGSHTTGSHAAGSHVAGSHAAGVHAAGGSHAKGAPRSADMVVNNATRGGGSSVAADARRVHVQGG